MAKRKRRAVFAGDLWMDPADGMPYTITKVWRDLSNGAVFLNAVDVYHSHHEFGEFEVLRNFDYVCDQHGDYEKDFFG